ncbi:hypothetical protein [Aquimarina rhabdastrellae]
MKKIIYITVFSVLFQSCYTYKPASFEDLKEGKTYAIKLKKGLDIETKYRGIKGDSIMFKINQNNVKIPKEEIVEMKRKKVSTLKLLGGIAIGIGGVILLLSNADKKTNKERLEEQVVR